jgi:hypothetical protein
MPCFRKLRIKTIGGIASGSACHRASYTEHHDAGARLCGLECCNTGEAVHSHGPHRCTETAQTVISTDGKGACRDTVFGERLWRSNEFEWVYLHADKTVFDARVGIG